MSNLSSAAAQHTDFVRLTIADVDPSIVIGVDSVRTAHGTLERIG